MGRDTCLQTFGNFTRDQTINLTLTAKEVMPARER
jgi:hypothetical protein